MKSLIISLKGLLYLKLVGLSVSFFHQIIQFVGFCPHHFNLWSQIHNVVLGKSSGALSCKVVLFFEHNSQAETEISEDGNLAELKYKKGSQIVECVFELHCCDLFRFFPKLFFFYGAILLLTFSKADLKKSLIVLHHLLLLIIFFAVSIQISLVIGFDVFVIEVPLLLLFKQTVQQILQHGLMEEQRRRS